MIYIYIYIIEAKWYVTKQPMDHWRNQRGNFKKYPQINDKTYGTQQQSFYLEVYCYRILPQETRKISNKQPTLYLKQLDKKEDQKQQKPKLLLRLMQN